MSHVSYWCSLTGTRAFGEQERLLAQSRVIKRIQKSSSIRMIWPHQRIYRVITEVLGWEFETKRPCSFSVILSFIPSVTGSASLLIHRWQEAASLDTSLLGGNNQLRLFILWSWQRFPVFDMFAMFATFHYHRSFFFRCFAQSSTLRGQLYIFKRNGETLSWLYTQWVIKQQAQLTSSESHLHYCK